VPRRDDGNGKTGDFLGLTVLCWMVLCVLLMNCGIEQNPGPVVAVENSVRLLHTAWGRSLEIENPM
jgi:hypothetical protein